MSGKTLLQLCNEISLITENIKENYPELHRHLDLQVNSAPARPDTRQHRDQFNSYLVSLKKILKKQMNQHPPVPQLLPNVADLLNYHPEKFVKTIIQDREGQKSILFAFGKKQELKTHSAPHDVILVMLEGLCAFTLENQVPHILHGGQVIIIPGKVKHSLLAISDFKMLLHV